ncbi:MAG: antitoxin family protein [Pirellulales bacterium]
MSQVFHAIYEDGVLRPLDPVHFTEHEQVLLAVQNSNGNTAPSEAELVQRQRESLAKLRAAMDALPSAAPVDGLGGADHDQILYGWTK